MTRRVAAGFDQRQPGQELGVSIDDSVAQVGVIPMPLPVLKTWVAGASQVVLLPLNDEFGARERIVETDVVDVEMGADDEIDIVRVESELRKLGDNIGRVDEGCAVRGGVIIGNAAVD